MTTQKNWAILAAPPGGNAPLVVMEPAPNLLMILRLALATTAIRLPRSPPAPEPLPMAAPLRTLILQPLTGRNGRATAVSDLMAAPVVWALVQPITSAGTPVVVTISGYRIRI